MNPQLQAEPTLQDLVRIYQRRKYVVYGVTLAVFLAAAIYCMLCTRRYEATGTVQVQKQGMGDMGLGDMLGGMGGADGSNPLEANLEIQTEAQILQSDTLALRTIEALNMENTQDFKPHFNPIRWMLGKISPAGVPDPAGASLENSPKRRSRALKVFSKNLWVKPIESTRVIEIGYSSPDPKLAAAVVNTLTRALADYTFQTRYDATNQASNWLSDQLGDLRKSSEELQAKVVNLQRESGVYSFGTTDAQGRDMAYSGTLDQLQQATTALAEAEQARILRGAIAKAAESGNAEMLSGLAGYSTGTTSGAGTSLSVIQGLRQQQATQEAALKEAEVKFGPAYPKLAEMRASLVDLNKSIQDEIGRIKGRAENDYRVALQTEKSVRQNYDAARRHADILNNKAIEYTIVRQEAEQSRGLYEDLLKRLKEAGVLEGLKSSNITLVDPARVPAIPKSPNVPLYMAGALFGGWLAGCCGAFLIHTLDNKVNTVQDLEDITNQTLLGVLPELPMSSTARLPGGVLALAQPGSNYIEALRAIRTSILLSQTDAPPKVILVTSGIAAEGKSYCALNLATLFAQSGRRTLVMDTDLRRGTLRSRLGLPVGEGLSELLAGQLEKAPIHVTPGMENLHVITSGRRPPNPTDLLESDSMKRWLQRFKGEYDCIVLDSAPVLPVPDSICLNLMSDVTLLIVRSRLTERPQVQRSYELLRGGGARYVGIVLNSLSTNDHSYYGYYGYRKYGYAYEEDKDAN